MRSLKQKWNVVNKHFTLKFNPELCGRGKASM